MKIRDIHVSLVVAEDEELTSITLSVRSPVASADLAYATQFKAPIELRVVSQPKPEMSPYARIGRFENYVYNTNSPDKAYIYHVEVSSSSVVLARYILTDSHVCYQ